jgi:polyhydroxyalkanoate synthesis regulator phasin
LDVVRQFIHAGIDAIERARSGLSSAVDGLVEKGTISREQAEAVLAAWKNNTSSGAASSPQESSKAEESSSAKSISDDLLQRIQKVAPVSREDFDQLIARVAKLERRIGSE